MSSTSRLGLVLVIAVVASLVVPLAAEAQGWEWIRKLSGPAYVKTVTGRVAFCVFGDKCAEVGGGPGLLIPKFSGDNIVPREQPAKVVGQIGVVMTYGWDGENLSAEIDGVNMLTIEDQFAVAMPWKPYLPRVFSIGVGFNRFSGNGIEGSFWRTSLIQTIMWRVPFTPFDRPGWYFEGGPKFNYFFTRLNAEDFGGIPEIGVVDGGEMGFSLFVRIGRRFNFTGGD